LRSFFLPTSLTLILKRLFSLFLALYILNFSIDSPDAAPDHISEDLSFNDIESFYEFFLEDIVGIENAVAEHDERDQDDGGSLDLKKFFLASYKAFLQPVYWRIERPSYLVSAVPDYFPDFFDLDGPPPKG
jgi:hypothetical protein